MHHGIQTLLSDPQKAEKEIAKKYKDEAQTARKEFSLSPYEEDDLAAQEYSTIGMLQAYRRKYSKFLADTEHVRTEHPIKYELNKQVVVVGQIDNVLLNRSLRWIWELKNLKSLDMDRVNSIKTDPQTGLYYKLYNLTAKKADRLDGILYQIVRKPSIRRKQKESRREFLVRLQEWYSSEDSGGLKFHLERIKGSFISGDAVLNTIDKVTQQMLNCKTKEDYFQDFGKCVSEWDKCAYYGLCHGNEAEEIKLLQIRKPYKVKQDDDEANVTD